MNDDLLKGDWKQIRGQVKDWWGRLTDDEIKQVDGHYERLIALLQERYGYSRPAAEDEVRNFLDQVEIKADRSSKA